MSTKKKIFNYAFLALMIGVTVGVFIFNFEMADIWAVLKGSNIWWILFGIGCMMLYIAAEGEGIRSICGVLGSKFSVGRGFIYSAIDVYFCAVTPSATGGAPVMMYYMSKDKVPMTHSSMAALLNTIMYTMSMVVLAAVSLILCPAILLDSGNLLFYICLGIGCFCSAGLVTICTLGIFKPVIIRKIGTAFILFGHKIRLVRRPDALRARLRKFCGDCEECSKILRAHPGVALWVLFCNIVQRSSAFLIGFAAYLALGFEPIENLNGDPSWWYTFIMLFGVQACATLATYAVPIPGGVGATEAMMLALYGLVYSTEAEQGAGLLLSRGISYYLNVLICGVIAVVYHSVVMRRESKLLAVETNAPPLAETEETEAEPRGDSPVEAVATEAADKAPVEQVISAPETASVMHEE